MTMAAQAKLLRVLEEGTVRRVGENKRVPIDVRILAATNRDLRAAIEEGEFRTTSSTAFRSSPSRSRLCANGPRISSRSRGTSSRSPCGGWAGAAIRPETLELLVSTLSGNVRELRYAIEQAVILSAGRDLTPEDFPSCGCAPAGARRVPHRRLLPERLSGPAPGSLENAAATGSGPPRAGHQPRDPLPPARPRPGENGGDRVEFACDANESRS